MGSIWLFVLIAQSAIPEPATIASERPRFAAGVEAGAGIAGAVEGGHGVLLGAGARMTIPLGGRYAFDARAQHQLPSPGAGIYELRVRRTVNWRGPIKPDYAGIGAVGYYALATGLYGKLEPRIDYVSKPVMVSFVAGWENRRGPRRATPLEVSLLVHPYGLFAASATIGVTWSPAPRARQ